MTISLLMPSRMVASSGITCTLLAVAHNHCRCLSFTAPLWLSDVGKFLLVIVSTILPLGFTGAFILSDQ